MAREEITVSVPPRRYDLLAEVLVKAAGEQRTGEPLGAAALRVAQRRGRELGLELGRVSDDEVTAREALIGVLALLGYEPSDDGTSIVLTNCPFHRLRLLDTELVCSVNEALAVGYLEALGSEVG